MENVFDPLQHRPGGMSPSPSPEAQTGWRNWLTTAVLVFVGVAIGGGLAAVLVPRQTPPTTLARAEKEIGRQGLKNGDEIGSESGSGQARPDVKPRASKPAATPDADAISTVRPLPDSTPNPSPKPFPKSPGEPAPKPAIRPGSQTDRKTPAVQPAVVKEPPATSSDNAAGKTDNSATAKNSTKQQETPTAPPEDAGKRAAYVKAVANVRLALWRRDLAAAHKHFKAVQNNAQSPADDKESERLDIMLDNLDKFWNGLRDAVAKLHTGDELELKDNRVAVVEASRDALMIHIYGRQQRYAIQSLPIALIKALVDSSFSPTPGTKVIVGTFLAMDKEGDRAGPRALGGCGQAWGVVGQRPAARVGRSHAGRSRRLGGKSPAFRSIGGLSTFRDFFFRLSQTSAYRFKVLILVGHGFVFVARNLGPFIGMYRELFVMNFVCLPHESSDLFFDHVNSRRIPIDLLHNNRVGPLLKVAQPNLDRAI